MNTVITQHNISKRVKDFHGKQFQILHKVELSINEGEFFVLLGPSGCGKSTLLRIMSGLDKAYTGTQTYDGLTKKDFGFVFQQFALLPWLTVEQNIAFGLLAKGSLSDEDQQNIAELLKLFGLERFAREYPKELSGGMKQRVGIARALAINPKIIFLDEPFSALDSFTAKALREELLAVWQKRKMTIVMVTHNIDEAVQLSDRIGVMSANPGTLTAVVENILPRPRELRAKEFFDMVDKLEGMVKV